jgi:hypothetical protein
MAPTLEDLDLEEINQDEVNNYTDLGYAYGMNLGHCVLMGIRHGPDGFLERVRYYVIHEEGPKRIDVTFYADSLDID